MYIYRYSTYIYINKWSDDGGKNRQPENRRWNKNTKKKEIETKKIYSIRLDSIIGDWEILRGKKGIYIVCNFVSVYNWVICDLFLLIERNLTHLISQSFPITYSFTAFAHCVGVVFLLCKLEIYQKLTIISTNLYLNWQIFELILSICTFCIQGQTKNRNGRYKNKIARTSVLCAVYNKISIIIITI